MNIEYILEDILPEDLKIVFCGTAPGRKSAQQSCYYAHPQNKFWRILYEAGFTPTLLPSSQFRDLPLYGLGLTDIAKNVSGMDSQLPPKSLGKEAIQALSLRITKCRPHILAFTSLTGGNKFLGRKTQAGIQKEKIGSTHIWVLPSPSPTANWAWDHRPWHQLREYSRSLEESYFLSIP